MTQLSDFETGWKTTGFLPDPALTFPASLARRLAEAPESAAFSEVGFERKEIREVSWSRLDVDRDARRAATVLIAAGVKPGDRLLLCIGETAPFFSFFLAAQALGAVPVPLPSPAEFRARAAFRERIESVAADCAPRAIVVDSDDGSDEFAGAMTGASILVPSVIYGLDLPAQLPDYNLERDFREIAFVQYTSGSTGSPKGVVVTHFNLAANLRAIAEAASFGPSDRSFNWLPLYHDMGLVGGFLVGLYLGLPTYVMPTRTFAGRPDSWLRAMSKFRATFACAPNFAYNMLAHRLPDAAFKDLDLSNWRLAFNGAEPLDRGTVEAFMDRFAPVGLSQGTMFPVYGMAECTLAAAFPVPRAAPRYDRIDRTTLSTDRRALAAAPEASSAISFVSVGRAMPGHRIRVLDPSGNDEVAERQVGEVAICGPSISPYYFRKDGDWPEPRTELRTGDLGYVAEGELYIVDRLKDLLIIGGRNLVPSDVERVVARIPGVRYGAVVAFAMRGSLGTEELFLVAGVDPQVNHEALREAVVSAVVEHFGIAPRDVVLVKPGVVPKTSSGKVRRAACRDLYERRALQEAVPT